MNWMLADGIKLFNDMKALAGRDMGIMSVDEPFCESTKYTWHNDSASLALPYGRWTSLCPCLCLAIPFQDMLLPGENWWGLHVGKESSCHHHI